ncbi:MAG TPA: NAD(P)(+) transhydrogenase (Re/Si-specific) subunit beta, partial [Alphaproteobacteria bacterium]|nr:NAD(P)(+) transhydrogenase (Re/Si-specific) subunit beta [Alphaproteobacteria bacterium]
MNETLTAFLYLIASVCFIMSLRGLSSPETSRGGLLYGVVGMVIAIATTVALPIVQSYWFIIAGIIAGGLVGALIAQKIQMTALPQLVAAFHSLVGLAAVAVAAAAFYAPEKFGIGVTGDIHPGSLVEMGLGVAVGAVTFTGSIIAFAKLQALMSGAPLVFPGQHILNAALGLGIIALIVAVIVTQSPLAFWGLVAVSLLLGFLLILPIGGADMPVVVSMLNSYS